MTELHENDIVEGIESLRDTLGWRGISRSAERDAAMMAAMADRKVRTIGAEASADSRAQAAERSRLHREARTLSGGTMRVLTRTDTRPGPTQGHLLWQVVDGDTPKRVTP